MRIWYFQAQKNPFSPDRKFSFKKSIISNLTHLIALNVRVDPELRWRITFETKMAQVFFFRKTINIILIYLFFSLCKFKKNPQSRFRVMKPCYTISQSEGLEGEGGRWGRPPSYDFFNPLSKLIPLMPQPHLTMKPSTLESETLNLFLKMIPRNKIWITGNCH